MILELGTKAVYSWRWGGIPVKAPVVGAELERIAEQNQGRVEPADVVEAATPDDAPLHPCFEWDDSRAAVNWRLEQASLMLRTIVVEVKDYHDKVVNVRAFVNVETSDDGEDGRAYMSITAVRADPTLFKSLLASALKDLRAFRRKYSAILSLQPVLAPLFDAMLEVETTALGEQNG